MLPNKLKSFRGIHLSLGFLLAMSGVFIAFEWEKSDGVYYVDEPTIDMHTYVEQDMPITYPKKKEVSIPLPKRPINLDLIEIVKDLNPDLGEEIDIIDELDNTTVTKEIDLVELPDGPGEVDEPMPVVIAEVMPQFPGGEAALKKYLQKNLKFPYLAQQHNIQGVVYVKFVITSTGEVSRIQVVRGVHPSLDNEAIRVVESMPNWIPGSQSGRKVSVYFTLPVRFVLGN